MGVLNITPTHSLRRSVPQRRCGPCPGPAAGRGGCRLIDVGGESTRPGRSTSGCSRNSTGAARAGGLAPRHRSPPVHRYHQECRSPAAIAAGADFVNDVSGLTFDAQMATVVADAGAGLFVMHTRGRRRPCRLTPAMRTWWPRSARRCRRVSPGPWRRGHGGTHRRRSGDRLRKDVAATSSCCGAARVCRSRPAAAARHVTQEFIGRVLVWMIPATRQAGTLATVALGVAGGARLFRVHEVGRRGRRR